MTPVRLGDAGYHVQVLQALLTLNDCDIEVNGSFGEDTYDALIEFQARYAITVSRGIATPETWSRLLLGDDSGVDT